MIISVSLFVTCKERGEDGVEISSEGEEERVWVSDERERSKGEEKKKKEKKKKKKKKKKNESCLLKSTSCFCRLAGARGSATKHLL